MKEYNEALRINHNDITVLDNKGAVLTVLEKYDDAMECFDQVLEIDPEDGIALQNKNMLEMKLQHKNLSDRISGYPKLGIIEKEGKSILEVKKK